MIDESLIRYWICIKEAKRSYVVVERLAASEGSFIAPDKDAAEDHCRIVLGITEKIRFA